MFQRSRKTAQAMAVVATAMAVSLSACSPPPAATPTNASAAAGDLDPHAVLRYVYPNSPGTLDPHVVNTAYANVPLFLIFDRLIHMDPKGDPTPGLAKSWEYSKDGLTLTLHLRSGVKFHDGAAFDGDVVKANIEHGKEVQGSFVKTDLASIDSVNVVDPLTVELKLNSADVALLLKLSDRAGAMISPKSMSDPKVNVHPVGAGMYEMDGDYQVGVKLKVKKWDGYWDPAAVKLAGVEMSFMADTTAGLNAIKSGGIDAGQIREPEIDPAKQARLNVLEGYDLGFQNIIMNPDLVPALKDERVRLAVNLAIDRKAIVDGVVFGYGKPTNQPFPEGYFAHSDAAEQYPYDPEQAKKLLAEAGYPNGFEWTIDNVPGPGTRINEAIADQLSKVGIKVTVRQTEAAALGAALSEAKTVAAANVRWTGRPDPTSTLTLIYMPGGPQNPSNMASENAKTLFDKQKIEIDPAKRAALLGELSKELVDHPPANIVLFQSVSAIAANQKVVGLQEWTSGKVEFRGVGMTK
ncbi:ABC transporter substrate-binding protein [Streptosporangium sp. NPDC087985]|uniref:ABC transporter substrate-binding protein n=1 Tax=Streptosporangium sp. NPDC087985 TaxID=3366196 RepID=UPI00382718CC